MTLEQATDIWVRLETAILSLEAAWPLAKGDLTAPESDIVMALQYARDALKVCKRNMRFALRYGVSGSRKG